MRTLWCFFFFFQAEDGIRDGRVTGVQTCALPICGRTAVTQCSRRPVPLDAIELPRPQRAHVRRAGGGRQIGRASCRERGEISGVAGSLKKKKEKEKRRK